MILNGGELDGARILSPITVEYMTQNHIDELDLDIYPPGVKYGLGFGVVVDKVKSEQFRPNGTLFWGGAYLTDFYIDPKHNLIASFYTQICPNWHLMWVSGTFETLAQTSIIEE